MIGLPIPPVDLPDPVAVAGSVGERLNAYAMEVFVLALAAGQDGEACYRQVLDTAALIDVSRPASRHGEAALLRAEVAELRAALDVAGLIDPPG